MKLFRILAVLSACFAASSTWALDGLQAQLDNAAPGTVLRIPAGVHQANLIIDKPLTLQGEPGAIIDGAGQGDVLRIKVSDVTVRNLVIRRSGTNLTTTDSGIFVEKDVQRITLADNHISESLFGIYLDGSAEVRVLGNTIRGLTQLSVADRGDGIHLWSNTNCVIEGNDISGARDGIYVYVSNHNTIARNKISEVRYGVHYMYSHNNHLIGNQSSNNLAGYALMTSKDLSIIGNSSDHDQAYGILFNYISNSEIAGNQISHVTGQRKVADGGEGKGMFVYLSQFNSIHDNRVTDSQIGIHMTAGSENNKLWNNSFINNRNQVKYAQNLAQRWSHAGRGNFWSDYLGWDLDGDGIGDVPFRPNDGVEVLLWKYPAAKALMSSPAILLLRYVQRAFPVFLPPAVEDDRPLIHAPPAFKYSYDTSH